MGTIWLSVKGYVIVMGDCNGDLGNSLGHKSTREPNQRGRKLLEFADYFNLCPVNLLGSCGGPTNAFFSHCGRYRSTFDHIFVPNYLFNEIRSAKTFDLCAENTSDHLPIWLNWISENILIVPQLWAMIGALLQEIGQKSSGQNFPQRKYTRNMSYSGSVICQSLTCVI